MIDQCLFPQYVHDALLFLQSFDFEEMSSDSHLVLFRNKHDVRIEVHHEQYTYALDYFFVPPLSADGYSRANLVGAVLGRTVRTWTATTEESIVHGLELFATELRELLNAIDEFSAESVFEKTRRHIADCEKQSAELSHLNECLDAASQCWSRGDWQGVCNILTPIRTKLTALHLARLDYASKRVSAQNH